MQDRLTSFRDNVLIASLFDNVLLRVELCHHPFKEGIVFLRNTERKASKKQVF